VKASNMIVYHANINPLLVRLLLFSELLQVELGPKKDPFGSVTAY